MISCWLDCLCARTLGQVSKNLGKTGLAALFLVMISSLVALADGLSEEVQESGPMGVMK